MAIGVIPARLHSTRFPRKILVSIHDEPMVLRVYHRAQKAQLLDKVIIAVDDESVRKTLLENDPEADIRLTDPQHPSGTDRVAEVVTQLDKDEALEIDTDIVVNLQADEPMLDADIVNAMVKEFDDRQVQMVTAVSTVLTADDLYNPNRVKALLDEYANAIAFKRELHDEDRVGYYHHLGLYAFRKATLFRFTGLPPTVNERLYHLEQYRALDNGIPIRAIITNYPYRGVDTEDDLQKLGLTP